MNLGESLLKNMEEAQEVFVKKEAEDGSQFVNLHTNSIEFHNKSDDVRHNFQHFHNRPPEEARIWNTS